MNLTVNTQGPIMSMALPQSPFRLKTHHCHQWRQPAKKQLREGLWTYSLLDLFLSRTRFIIHYSFMETVLFFIVNVQTLNIPYSSSFSKSCSLFVFHFHPRADLNMAAPYKAQSIILCGTFRRISQLWDNEHTTNYENCLLYSSSIISWFLHFIHCLLFDFIFYCVTMHTLYKRKKAS